MKCKKCGENLPDNVNFCMNCGAKIREEIAPVSDKIYVELIYNHSGIDVFSNNESILKELYSLTREMLNSKNHAMLSEIKAAANLFTFQYSKKLFSFKDDSCNSILSLSRDYLTENGWDYNKRIRGFDTSKYKFVFTKYIERE